MHSPMDEMHNAVTVHRLFAGMECTCCTCGMCYCVVKVRYDSNGSITDALCCNLLASFRLYLDKGVRIIITDFKTHSATLQYIGPSGIRSIGSVKSLEHALFQVLVIGHILNNGI
jgi:hypothetical protein